MPRIEYDTFKPISKTNYDFPKLKLKVGEFARIVLLEAPWTEWTHRLEKFSIQDGKPVWIKKTRMNGTEYEVRQKDFISNPICLGKQEIIEGDGKGLDPQNCPICALAKENPELAEAPKRRFAVNAVRYRTKPGGNVLTTPFSVDWVVWQFPEKRAGRIISLREEWGDLRKHDLILGPCEAPESFQKYEINISPRAEWLEDDDRKQRTLATYNDNKMDDLAAACGSIKEPTWLNQDIEQVRESWFQVQATEGKAADPVAPQQSLSDGLAGLMDDLGPSVPNSGTLVSTPDPNQFIMNEGGAAAGDDLDGLFGPATTTAPEQDSSPAPKQESASAGDLDDLLADIDI